MSKVARNRKKRALTTIEYVKLKKYLSQYHKFSFKNPRKNKDFTRSQKSSITRQFNKIGRLIQDARLDKISYINTSHLKRKDIPKNDGVKTNKGFFFKYPYTSIKNIRLKKGEPTQKMLYTDFSLIAKTERFKGTLSSDFVQTYIVIPESAKTSPDTLAGYIEDVREHYTPEFLMTTAKGVKYSTTFSPKEFFKYTEELEQDLDDLEDIEEDDLTEDQKKLKTKKQFFLKVSTGEFDPYYAIILGFRKKW